MKIKVETPRQLTPLRLTLLKRINCAEPTPLRQLAREFGRDLKNISQDIGIFEEMGIPIERGANGVSVEIGDELVLVIDMNTDTSIKKNKSAKKKAGKK